MAELIKYEEKTVLEAFLDPEGLTLVIQEVRDLVDNFDHDLSSGKGRKETISFAKKISTFKGKIDDLGKGLVSEWKAKSNAVDINRKAARDSLDELKIIARKPVTDWEVDQEIITIEKLAIKKAEELKAKMENDHEFANLMNASRDLELANKKMQDEKQARIDAEKSEQERLAREEKIKKEAIEQVRIDAEQKANDEAEKVAREKREALQREQRLKDDAKKAKRDKIAAKQKAKVDAENAEKRRIEDIKKAKQDEINRQKAEETRKQKALEKREADRKHVGAVMKKAKEALMVTAGIDEATSKVIILAIKNEDIPAIYIKF